MSNNSKQGKGRMILISVLVCVAAAGIFLLAYLNKEERQPAVLATSSEPQPSEMSASEAAKTPTPESTPTPTSSPSIVLPDLNLSAWVADWQWQAGIDDLKQTTKVPDSLQAFAANFVLDNINVSEDLTSMLTGLNEIITANPDTSLYMSIVNDRQDESGKWTEKDSGLVDRLLASKETRAAHIAQIVNLVDTYGLKGIEIDYEKVSDASWTSYCLFCGELYEALSTRGVALRVVLEPRNPIENGDLSAGPEYVMMAYNLYGTGTEPGPKADYNFIRELAARMEYLPGEKRIAFATGGFQWNGAEISQLTEAEAFDLSQTSASEIIRDENSGALHFSYMTEDGKEYTVWYADGETLSGWIGLSRSLGYGNAAIWRLGGTRPETLQALADLMDER